MGKINGPTLSQLDGLIGLISFLYDHEKRAAVVAEFRETLAEHEASHERYESECGALADLRALVLGKEDDISKREADVTAREERVIAAEGDIAQRTAALDAREAVAASAKADLERWDAQLRGDHQALAQSSGDHDKRDAALTAREAAVAKREEELAPLIAARMALKGTNG